MSEIGLRRCERAGPLDAVNLGQAAEFDGIAGRGAGAVCLHHADGVRVHARRCQCGPIGRDLRGLRRCGDIHRAAISTQGRAANRSQDPVPIAQRTR